MNRAKSLNPTNVAQFYANLEDLYSQNQYEAWQVWNCNESGAQANRNGEGVVFAKRGTKNVHTIVPQEREWLSVLVVVSSVGGTMPSYYVFKGKRPNADFISLCENDACLGMQENAYMDAENFSKWMDFFITYHEKRGDLSLTNRMLLVFDGHKSHVTLEVLLKVKSHGLDMISLPSHTSHCLQPLDISCFRPFKESFRAHRDAWTKKNIGKRVGKKILAQWVSLALHRALTMSNIQAGFRATGIQPLNKNAIVGKWGQVSYFSLLKSLWKHQMKRMWKDNHLKSATLKWRKY